MKLRYRGKKITKFVQDLDSFQKLPSDFKIYTGVGGLTTLLMLLFMLWLLSAEVLYYMEPKFENKFVPDTNVHEKLKLSVDMTVAMPCHYVGADIIDVTNEESQDLGSFQFVDEWFEMGPEQKEYFEGIQYTNSYLKSQYHALRTLIWRSGYFYSRNVPKRDEIPQREHDACRILGEFELNKVSGNFHVTAGRSFAVPGGHVHLPNFFDHIGANFSHRIDKFYFGTPSDGIIHPLEGTLNLAPDYNYLYKYFLKVVPTDLNTSRDRCKTFQYSVSELSRSVAQSSQMPGIFVKYDMNAFKVEIKERDESIFNVILRICGCTGGLYIICGFLKSAMESSLSPYLEMRPKK